MKQREILEGIIDKYGIKHQVTVAIEELAELTKELTKWQRNKLSASHVCEEIADVEICLEQLKLMLHRSRLQIKLFKRFKFERLQKLYIEGDET